MSKPARRRKSLPRVRLVRPDQRKSAAADGEVGYGKPPKAHQFKPGKSGNPKGRPKGSKNESTILHELLQRKLDLRQNGHPRKVVILEAILLRMVEDALKGNTKSAAFLLNRYGTMVSGELRKRDLNELSEDDREVLDSLAKRLGAPGWPSE